ncbi:hypothetical protein V8F06_009970 [Rhypophila decipiens]
MPFTRTQSQQAVLSSARPSSIIALNSSVLACQPLDPHNFHEHDLDVQALYTNWSNSLPSPCPPVYDASETVDRRSVWANKAAAAWLLSRQLHDQTFERYALAQLIRHCGTALFGPWAFIEARCPAGSSIRRFTNHWVAWNASFCPVGTASEYRGLYATTLANRAVRNETHDPRTFDLDHWFQPCGDDLVAKCDHDPVVRRAKEREKLRPKTPDPSGAGIAEELGIDTSGWTWRIANASAKLGGRISSRRKWKPLRWCFGMFIPLILANPLGTMMFLFGLNLAMVAILAGTQLDHRSTTPGLRQSNVRFSMALVIGGFGQFALVFVKWTRRRDRMFILVYVAVFIVWALGNGAAWIVDMESCNAYRGGRRCVQVTATAVFVWFCVPLSLLHWFLIRRRNNQAKRLILPVRSKRPVNLPKLMRTFQPTPGSSQTGNP